MSRIRSIVLLVIAAGITVLVINPFATAAYRVDAMFDTADHITSGMQVKVAGVPVGSVAGVKLTRGLKALIEMQVDRRFAPFHVDASCQILPEGIISNNYVQCNPGSSRLPPLRATADGGPTVPLARDSTPVSLQQFIDIFSLPVADRLRVLINELGIATAGKGDDLNSILRRANPTLGVADRVLRTLDAQRQQLAGAVDQTDQVVTQLAIEPGAVREFVDRAATVTETTAAHRGALGAAIDRLPPLLGQVRQATDSLQRVTTSGIPLLTALRAAAPALTELTSTLPRFTTAALPAVHSLASLAAEGRTALPAAIPLVTDLRRFATGARPAARLLDQLLVNLRQRGGFEYAMEFVYGIGVVLAPFDGISHVLGVDLSATTCLTDPASAACNRGWGSIASRLQAGSAPPASSRRSLKPAAKPRRPAPAATTRTPRPSQPGAGAGGSSSGQPTTSTPTTSAPTGTPPPSGPSPNPAETLAGLLKYLLK